MKKDPFVQLMSRCAEELLWRTYSETSLSSGSLGSLGTGSSSWSGEARSSSNTSSTLNNRHEETVSPFGFGVLALVEFVRVQEMSFYFQVLKVDVDTHSSSLSSSQAVSTGVTLQG